MFLPGCDRCGQCGCVCGKLPYTLTVEFDGLVNRTHSTYCPLTITSNFGCGATAVATSPGGCDDNEPDCGASNRGPLGGVLLLDGGHDYAKIGRVIPTLTIAGSGSGATFAATMEPVDETLAEPCRSYRIASIDVSGEGTGYVNGETLKITTDGVIVTSAVATLVTTATRVQPTVTASVATVSGESLAVTLASNGDTPETWGVASVGVTGAGSGWPADGPRPASWTLPVVFSSTGTTVTAATADAVREVINPGAELGVSSGGTGLGATLTLSQITDMDGYPAWIPDTVTITNGGSGYSVGDYVEFYSVGGYNTIDGVYGLANYSVASVDGSGAVLTLTLGVPGFDPYDIFRQFTGGIGSVVVSDAGSYYAVSETGVPESVTVLEEDGGEYYTEDPNAPACLAEVTVSADACGGSGAEITATIGDDPEDAETWGRITALTIDDGGDDYLAWHWICTQQSDMNGVPFVLTAVEPQKLVTLNVSSDFGSGACLRVVPVGDGTTCDPPTPVLYDGQPGPIRQVDVVSQGSGYARTVGGNLEVATVTVSVAQLLPSAGSGAAISVTIGTTAGANFGKVLSATITNGGSGYTLLGGPAQCVYSASPCGNEYQPLIEYRLRGNGQPPEVVLTDNRTIPGNTTVLRCADPLADCDDLPASATLLYGAPSGVTATITPGGTVTTECEQPALCGDASCVCAPGGSECPDAPFTFLCDENEGICQPGGEGFGGLYPPYWTAAGSYEEVVGGPISPLVKSNAAQLRCHNKFMYLGGECVFVKWLVTAQSSVVCPPFTTDAGATNHYYGLVDCDEDGYPVAGPVTLTFDFLEVGLATDCGQEFPDPPVVEITRP